MMTGLFAARTRGPTSPRGEQKGARTLAGESGAAPRPAGLLGKGIYDLSEAARIIKRDPGTIGHWTKGDPPLHPVTHDRILSFLDLISLWVISELLRRRVPRREIRSGRDYAANKVGTQYPFAHQELATVGAGFFARLDTSEEWVDAGMGGQGSFPEMIKELIRPIKYGPDLHAAQWRPAKRILLDPLIQAGAPCIEGTRVLTRVVADLKQAGEHIKDIADHMRLKTAEVDAALQYELAA